MSIESNEFDAPLITDKNRPFVVKLLRDNDESVLREDFFGADDRVEGAESGEVRIDS